MFITALYQNISYTYIYINTQGGLATDQTIGWSIKCRRQPLRHQCRTILHWRGGSCDVHYIHTNNIIPINNDQSYASMKSVCTPTINIRWFDPAIHSRLRRVPHPFVVSNVLWCRTTRKWILFHPVIKSLMAKRHLSKWANVRWIIRGLELGWWWCGKRDQNLFCSHIATMISTNICQRLMPFHWRFALFSSEIIGEFKTLFSQYQSIGGVVELSIPESTSTHPRLELSRLLLYSANEAQLKTLKTEL